MRIIDKQDSENIFSIAIVVSRFNEVITSKLKEGALERLKELNFEDDRITIVNVPGAIEIPLVVSQLANSHRYKAIVTLGAVIRGETSHYDYVCELVCSGIQAASLENDMPVIFGVLTTDNVEQAQDRIGGKNGHRGRDAIDAAVEMVAVMNALR